MALKLTQTLLLIGFCALLIGAIAPTTLIQAKDISGPIFPTYTGYVRDMNGRGISNVYVRLFSQGYQVSTDYTDSNGYYCVGNDIVIGGYISVQKTGWVSQSKSVSTSGGTYNFNLKTSALALVVAGSDDERFTRDAFGFYNTLIDHYSFDAARIYLITPRTTIDGTNVPRDAATSQANVEWACNQIENLATSNDQVIVYWTGHGIEYSIWPFNPWYTFECGSNEMTRNELDNALDDITCKQMILLLGPCHSGYFIGGGLDDESNRAIYTSCKTSESGHAYTTHSYWPWAVYQALDPGSGSYQKAEEADANSDGRVSIYELYSWAYNYITITKGFTDQHPQRWVGSGITDSSCYIGDMYY